MKKVLLTIFVTFFFVFSINAATADNNLSDIQITKNLASMPLSFTQNQGQWDDKVQFRANTGGATMWFSSDGAYYQFTRTIESEERSEQQTSPSAHDVTLNEVEERHHQPDSYEAMMIKANFIGSNPAPVMVGLNEMEYKCNYFIGNDESKWATDVPNYSAVMYEEIYDGIDLRYYGNGKQMEYDFIVSPGADFSQIKIQYEGAESVSVNDNGELVVTTKWGEVVEQRPVIYQIENNNRVSIDGNYILQADNSFGFELSGSFDAALAVVIDPVLSYSTYLGGSDLEESTDIAIDDSGSIYITGWTYSTDFPIEGEYQSYQGSTDRADVFVTKLNSAGNTLVYSTYLGGNNYDIGHGIVIDSSGNCYITGVTTSNNFPIEGAYQADQIGSDGFVTKLNSTGNALIYSTYLGGNGDDQSFSIDVDGFGNAYITGVTTSNNFPIEGAYQTYQGGNDAFVTKLNSFGNALTYSTYLGGSAHERGYGITLDNSGNTYITGFTESTDFPTEGAYQTSYQGGYQDVFVTKLNSSGNTLIYSTFLGGSDTETGEDIAVDSLGNAYITGRTSSNNFPIEGAYQTYQGGNDAFVTKLNSFGNALTYSTYLGGSADDWGHGIEVDSFGNAYIIGTTSSSDFPILREYQIHHGLDDAFVIKLNNSGLALVYSTYLGGNDSEFGSDIALDGFYNAYVTGNTSSTNFPTEGEYQTNLSGARDGFVAQISCCDGIRGDINYDALDQIDIADLVYFVDYSFGNPQGPEPPCFEEADVDASASLDIADIVYLVSYMFNGGPAPVVCP